MVNRELRQPVDSPDDAIVILTAPTGTAAYAIRGQTLHSAFMISAKGIATLSAEKLAMLRNKFPKLILIITDEVSMVGGNLLKLVHERCAATRGLPLALPITGISVLAIGDFQQLSPVGESPVYKPPRSGYVGLAKLWMSNFKIVELTDIMRQQGDTAFADLLSRLRVGRQTSDDLDTLKSRQITIKADDTMYDHHLHIFARNDDVNSYNERRLKSIPGPSVTLNARDQWPACCKERSAVLSEKNTGLFTKLTLKFSARVMLVKNVDTDVGLFNGALGVVTRFLSDLSSVPTAALVLFDNQKLRKVSADRHPPMNGSFSVERAKARFPVRKGNSVVEVNRLQFPLKIVFAMTIHKCQGQTLNFVVVSLKGRFGPAQAYVALSRCKSLDNLFITDLNAKNIKVNKSGLEALATMKNEEPLPLLHQPWLNDKGNSLRLAYLNTRFLQKHADDIINSIYLDLCDVAVYAETRLQDDNVPNQFSHSRLFCANAPRQHNYVAGLAIVVFTDVVAEQVFCVTLELFQLLVVRVSAKKQVVNIVAVYRSPALSIKLFYQIIDKHLHPVIADSSTPSLVIGDFNVDAWQSIVLTGVIQQVNSATHTGGAILDYVYWTGETDRIATEVDGCHCSDHNIVAVRIGDVVATAAHSTGQ